MWVDFKMRFVVSIGTKFKFAIRARVRHRTSKKKNNNFTGFELFAERHILFVFPLCVTARCLQFMSVPSHALALWCKHRLLG